MSAPTSNDLLFRALSDPTRRVLLERLCREGEQTVAALTGMAGVSQPVVSRHLGVLKQAGLVQGRPEGRNTYYSAKLKGLAPLLHWARHMGVFWEERFNDLEHLLNRMDQ
jgi:DNA-binding transcriptional ArsR family regulator